MRHLLHSLAAAGLLAALAAFPALAHDAHDHAAAVAGDLAVSDGWARAMLPGQRAGGGYLTIENRGVQPDRLVGGSTPAAGRLEIHTMEVVDDVMTMRPLAGGLEIPAGGTVELAPGGEHLMFMDVAEPFSQGDSLPVTLEFERAGSVEVELPVRAATGGHGGEDGCPSEHGH